MRKSLIKFVGGVFFAIGIAGFAFGTAQAQSALGGGRLEGSWDVRVTTYNCATGAVIRSFDSVTQFMKGGTLIDSTSVVPQALKTPGQGIWRHSGGDSYSFRFKVFGFDPAGNYIGYQIVAHEAQMDSSGLTYVSQGTAASYTPNGNLVMTLCSSTVATKMIFQQSDGPIGNVTSLPN